MDAEQVAENLAVVRDTVEHAAAGRDVRLIAVSKFVDADRMKTVRDAGILDFGENYPQHLTEKYDKIAGIRWHMIGQMQTNKVKYIIGKAVMIQSLDRMSLAEEISRRAQKASLTQDVLVQVNIGREPQKGGILPEETESFLASIAPLPGMRVRGFMAIPPAEGDPECWFTAMRELYDRYRTADPSMIMDTLSMGMSHDYARAIACGSTMVRVGTAIFGPRITTVQEK